MTKARLIWCMVLMCVWIGGAEVSADEQVTKVSRQRRWTAFEAWAVYQSSHWPELGELTQDSLTKALTARMYDLHAVGDFGSPMFSVTNVCDFRSPFFAANFRLVYIKECGEAVSQIPVVALIMIDSTGQLLPLDPPDFGPPPYPDMEGRLAITAQTLNQHMKLESLDSATAVLAAIDIVSLMEYCRPTIFVDSAADIDRFSSAVTSANFWEEYERDDSVRMLITSFRLFGVSSNDRLWNEFMSGDSELTSAVAYIDVIRPPFATMVEQGCWLTQIVVWSPWVGRIVRWRVRLCSGQSFTYERVMIAEEIGFVFPW